MFTSIGKALGALTHSPFDAAVRLAHQHAQRYLENGGVVSTKPSGGGQKPFMLPADVDPTAVASLIRRRIGKAPPTGEPVVRLGRRAFVAVPWLRWLGGGDIERGRRILDQISDDCRNRRRGLAAGGLFLSR